MLLTTKTILQTKQRLFLEQKGICPLCQRELDAHIEKNHLDHDHQLDGEQAGKVRGLLCLYCNPLEGKLLNEFKRSGLASRGVNYVRYLRQLADYLEQDNSGNAIHPQLVPDLKKRFKRLDKQAMIAELTVRGIKHSALSPKAELISIYSKAIKAAISV
ncbi:endonuclease domain-containing protein [Aeromonas salmonicida]|uniref:endonuclease domain-containing protein n=1 Tax=Aeromonas salmonicida TaxID=645 RepID=UPI003D31B4F9